MNGGLVDRRSGSKSAKLAAVLGRVLVVAALFLAACASATTEPATSQQAAAPAKVPTELPAPTPTEPPAVATPSPTPTAMPSATVTPSPVPTSTSEPTAPPEPTAEPTAPPEPTATPEPTFPEPACRVIDDFAASGAQWQVVLDGVMGGRSTGQATISDGVLTLTGTINTNGGGFVMIRRLIQPADLADATSLRFVAESDGRSYEVMVSDALPGRPRSVSHFATIDFPSGTVALADLEPRSFGTPVVTESFRADLAFSLGVILSDGIDGDFVIRLDRIEACD